jgi:hypothetical protein
MNIDMLVGVSIVVLAFGAGYLVGYKCLEWSINSQINKWNKDNETKE